MESNRLPFLLQAGVLVVLFATMLAITGKQLLCTKTAIRTSTGQNMKPLYNTTNGDPSEWHISKCRKVNFLQFTCAYRTTKNKNGHSVCLDIKRMRIVLNSLLFCILANACAMVLTFHHADYWKKKIRYLAIAGETLAVICALSWTEMYVQWSIDLLFNNYSCAHRSTLINWKLLRLNAIPQIPFIWWVALNLVWLNVILHAVIIVVTYTSWYCKTITVVNAGQLVKE
ncbi:hypothetical protein D918_06403 [Trichuris suis]|uniref:Uncharacterized protein n=1 Tax=Trichuris suis TaxID=68888 RepID=A0A085LK52_9BILA|nr:hypothetical protein M513_13777 [Trichuris suis]KHJ43494.1 hypothetical protein D918_06403 [Trichuris suis]